MGNLLATIFSKNGRLESEIAKLSEKVEEIKEDIVAMRRESVRDREKMRELHLRLEILERIIHAESSSGSQAGGQQHLEELIRGAYGFGQQLGDYFNRQGFNFDPAGPQRQYASTRQSEARSTSNFSMSSYRSNHNRGRKSSFSQYMKFLGRSSTPRFRVSTMSPVTGPGEISFRKGLNKLIFVSSPSFNPY